MIAAYIIIPNVIITGIIAYFIYLYPNEWWNFTIVLPVTIIGATYVIRQQLLEWWYSKYPPGLSKIETDILQKHYPYYAALNPVHQKSFEDRISIFRVQKSFQMRALEKIPGDIQLLFSASAVQVSMGFENQREFFPKLGMIVLFPKLFITPQLNEQLHAVEYHQDQYDCVLIAINMFIKGLKAPSKYYHTGIHAMAKALKVELGISDRDIPHSDHKELLVQLHQLRGFKIGYQFDYTALEDMEIFEMCSEHFFQAPNELQEALPKVYQYLMKIYQQDPVNRSNPIIQNAVLED